MNLVSVALTIIVLSLSLFSLVSTMAANIVEQSKELAILRCVGLSRWKIGFVYLIESTVVVMTGGVIGLIVGTIVAWSMVSQNALFTNAITEFKFPYAVFITVILFSLISSLVAAFIPAVIFLKRKIVALIKEIG